MAVNKFGVSTLDTKVFTQVNNIGRSSTYPELENFNMKEEQHWEAQEEALTV